MMRFLVCISEVTPCPPADQQWSTTAEILDPAQFGVSPVEILKVYSWGFGAVLLMFFIGYQLGCALGVIKRL